jgi:hypothetical protein
MLGRTGMMRWRALLVVAAGTGFGCSAGDEVGTESRPSGEPLTGTPAASQPNAAARQATPLLQRDRARRVVGVSATGLTADESAESFRQNGVAELGITADELKPATRKGAVLAKRSGVAGASSQAEGVGLMYDPATGQPKFRLYSYDQQRDGVPVFRAGLRTLVREGGDNPVVWANVDLRPMADFRAKTSVPARPIDLARSLDALRVSNAATGQPTPSALIAPSAGSQTVFAGVDGQTTAPRLAVQYTAKAADGAGKWTFVADAETGDILHVESNVHFDVAGTVKGRVVTSAEAAECGVLGTVALPHANVTSPSGNAVTDQAGAFTIKQTGSAPFNIATNLSGKYFAINDAGTSNSLSLRVTPPGPANFVHQDNQVPPEKVLAQLNAYKGLNDLRDLLLASVPNYPVISTETGFKVNVNVNDTQTCERTGGAWYDGDIIPNSINFCPRNTEHANTAFRSIIHHEYGHHIVESAGSGQAEYGEGMADTIAMLFAKDPKIGSGYYLNQCGTPLRNANTTCQYDANNCSSCGGYYECGNMLSGIVWDIWKNLDVTLPTTSANIIRQLVFSSILLHSGTRIDPSIAIDMLTLDDNDALLENGTPHYSQICAGFAAHGMTCPAIVNGLVVKGTDLVAEGLSGGPFAPASTSYTLYNLGPQQNLAYSVAVPAASRWLTTNKTSGTIALGQSTTVTLTIDQAQAKLLADGRYTAAVQFVNSTSGVGTVTRDEKLRVGAPVPIYTANFSDGLQGFTGDGQEGNLWHQSTACADSLAGHTTPGSLYYGKDASCTYTTPVPYSHAITSPEITIANPQTAELGFKYYLKTQNSSSADAASALLSVNGGAFQVVASNNLVAGQKLKETSAWQELRFDIAPFLPATGPTRIKLQFAFNAGDIYDNSTTGFVVDDIIVYAQTQSTTLGPCASYCSNPKKFNGAAYYSSGNLGTAATCHESALPIRGGNCGNFVNPRKLYVNGTAMTCNWSNWASIPPAKNGGYCVYTTGGNYSYAGFTTW